MGFEQDTSDAAEAHEVEQHKLTHLPFGDIARSKVKESSHHESGPGGVSKFGTDNMGEDGTPITTPACSRRIDGTYFAKARVMVTQKKQSRRTCCPQVIR